MACARHCPLAPSSYLAHAAEQGPAYITYPRAPSAYLGHAPQQGYPRTGFSSAFLSLTTCTRCTPKKSVTAARARGAWRHGVNGLVERKTGENASRTWGAGALWLMAGVNVHCAISSASCRDRSSASWACRASLYLSMWRPSVSGA